MKRHYSPPVSTVKSRAKHSRKFDNLIGKCVGDLIKAGVNVELAAEKEIDCDGLGVSGYFDDSVPVLKMATKQKRNDWRLLFLHEYCHFVQWKEGMFDVFDGLLNLDDWYGENCTFDFETAEYLTRVYQAVELDCEKRVVDLLRRRKIDVDRKTYIKAANAYVLLYQLALERKEWIKAGAYTRPKLLDYSPEDWITDCSKVPKNFRKYAERYCF